MTRFKEEEEKEEEADLIIFLGVEFTLFRYTHDIHFIHTMNTHSPCKTPRDNPDC